MTFEEANIIIRKGNEAETLGITQEEFDAANECFGIVEHDNLCDKCIHYCGKDGNDRCSMAEWWKYVKCCNFYKEAGQDV